MLILLCLSYDDEVKAEGAGRHRDIFAVAGRLLFAVTVDSGGGTAGKKRDFLWDLITVHSRVQARTRL